MIVLALWTLIGVLLIIHAEVRVVSRKVTTMDARLTKLIADFNDETNAISAKIDALTTGGQSADEIVAALQPISDRLKVLGANPAQPIPPGE